MPTKLGSLYESDGYNILGEGAGSIRWVRVLACPKDHPDDTVPMFTPGESKFPFDQFIEGLRNGIWPIGMRVQVTFFRYEGMGNGRHGRLKRRRYDEKKSYTVEKRQRGLVERLETDYEMFTQRAKEHFGEEK